MNNPKKNNDNLQKLPADELVNELERLSDEHRRTLTEMRELTAQLKIVNEKLTESEALKSHFISNITNEIVNPFASILGLSRNIMSLKPENWDKVMNMVKLIYSEAFSLDFQLKNIFAAAELEAGENIPQISRIDILSLIETVIESFDHEIKKKNLTVEVVNELKKEFTQTCNFKSDAEKLQLIIGNILSNAIKFSIAGDKIKIFLKCVHDKLKLTIQDYGIGISQNDQKQIFDRFKRLDNSINSINRGHGLGLSITMSLIDLLKGNIEIKSSKNKGASFIITIPQSEIEIEDLAPDGNEVFFGEDEIF